MPGNTFLRYMMELQREFPLARYNLLFIYYIITDMRVHFAGAVSINPMPDLFLFQESLPGHYNIMPYKGEDCFCEPQHHTSLNHEGE